MAILDGLTTPVNTNDASTKAYVDSLAGGSGGTLPTGAIAPFPGTSLPSGYVLCDGSAYSRTTYSALYALCNFTQTGTLNGTTLVTGLTSTSHMYIGMRVEGTTVPNGTAITLINSSTSVTLSNTTGSGAQVLRFFLYGQGDGSTTFNVPNFRTNTSIPIGEDTANATANALGKPSLGSYAHYHTIPAHQHTFSHGHTVNTAHAHTWSHYHDMGNHTHTISHNHDQSHQHTFADHYHSNPFTLNGDNHTHNMTERQTPGVGTGQPRPSDGSGGTVNYTSSSFSETITVSGSIGLSGGYSGDSNGGWWGISGGASVTSTTGISSAGSTGPSTNITSTATGASTNTNTFTLSTNSGTTDLNAAGNAGTAYMPQVTVNFMVKT